MPVVTVPTVESGRRMSNLASASGAAGVSLDCLTIRSAPVGTGVGVPIGVAVAGTGVAVGGMGVAGGGTGVAVDGTGVVGVGTGVVVVGTAVGIKLTVLRTSTETVPVSGIVRVDGLPATVTDTELV